MPSACMVQFSAVSAGVEPRPIGPEFSALTVGPMHQPTILGRCQTMNTVSICMAGYIVGCCTGRRGSLTVKFEIILVFIHMNYTEFLIHIHVICLFTFLTWYFMLLVNCL